MKKENIIHIALMAIAAFGLLLITESFPIALGIFLLLILIEYLIIDRVSVRRRRKEREERLREEEEQP